MAGFLIKLLINFTALITVVNIVPGVAIDRFETAIIAALVLSLINAFLRPAVIFITLPLTIVSLGVFTLFINGFLFYIASKIVKGFVITDFWSAFWGALFFSIISFLLNLFINPQGRVRMDFRTFRGRQIKDENVIDVDYKVEDGKDSDL